MWLNNLEKFNRYQKIKHRDRVGTIDDFYLNKDLVYLYRITWEDSGDTVIYTLEELEEMVSDSQKQIFSSTECPVVKQSNCDHRWKPYQGLVETFEYCTECDFKRR